MTDKELIELAAKAAKYTLGQHSQKDWAVTYRGAEWNPLVDDGDAMRLAVDLDMLWDADIFDYEPEDFKRDPYAATRRAITKAAAILARGQQ